MRSRVSLLLALTVCAGCSFGTNTVDVDSREASIDELAGSYKGVALGDPRNAILRVFGEPAETDGPATPLGSDPYDGGPLTQGPARAGTPSGRISTATRTSRLCRRRPHMASGAW
jgi:hypothetical protein